EIAQIVQPPLVLLVSIGLVPTPRTRLACVGATGRDDLWWGQVGNRGNSFGGIGSIHTRTDHGCVLLEHVGDSTIRQMPHRSHTKARCFSYSSKMPRDSVPARRSYFRLLAMASPPLDARRNLLI